MVNENGKPLVEGTSDETEARVNSITGEEGIEGDACGQTPDNPDYHPGNIRVKCKNCDNEFSGNYCNSCGQSSKDFDRPVSVLVVDAMANMWAFDTRLWKSLKSILFKPGEMALDYIAGKRVRYMPPFRLYLFISFIFFLLLKLSANADTNIKLITIKDKAENAGNEQVVNVDEAIKVVSDQKKDEVKESVNNNNLEDIISNKELYLSRFFTYMSWALIVMMPVYSMLLWFLFRKHQKHYLAHFIFSLNQHAFLFFILSVLIIISLIFPHKQTMYEAWLLLVFPVYLFAGGRKLYNAKWRKIIFRMSAAFFIYQLIIVLVIALVLYLVLYKFF